MSEWSLSTLYVHLSRIVDDLAKSVDDRFAFEAKLALGARETINIAIQAVERAAMAEASSAKNAVDKAESATAVRFAGVNEFRQTLSDQAGRLMPRAEVETAVNGLNAKIADLTARIGAMESRGAGIQSGWGYLVGGISLVALVVGAIMLFVRK
jgi:hypothetical protein